MGSPVYYFFLIIFFCINYPIISALSSPIFLVDPLINFLWKALLPVLILIFNCLFWFKKIPYFNYEKMAELTNNLNGYYTRIVLWILVPTLFSIYLSLFIQGLFSFSVELFATKPHIEEAYITRFQCSPVKGGGVNLKVEILDKLQKSRTLTGDSAYCNTAYALDKIIGLPMQLTVRSSSIGWVVDGTNLNALLDATKIKQAR